MDEARPLRLMIVDDSALYRQTVRNVLRELPFVDVVGSAGNGKEALEKISELDPDVVTLDYEMPVMDGLQVLRRTSQSKSAPKFIMLSSYTEEGAKVTTDALLLGAFDFIQKPNSGSPEESRQVLLGALTEKLTSIKEPVSEERSSSGSEIKSFADASQQCDMIVIGASTGGPLALRHILSELPGDLAIPIVVVQHMPMRFTAPLAKRLGQESKLEVVETTNTTRIRPGGVYIAAGGYHTKLIRRNFDILSQLTKDPKENSCRPSVDYTLRYAVQHFRDRVCAVILTGMGQDGTAGCQTVKDHGGIVLAQHPDDCAVYGMPKAVIQRGLADGVLRLDEIPAAIRQLSNH